MDQHGTHFQLDKRGFRPGVGNLLAPAGQIEDKQLARISEAVKKSFMQSFHF